MNKANNLKKATLVLVVTCLVSLISLAFSVFPETTTSQEAKAENDVSGPQILSASVEPELNILNPHSDPKAGDNWAVSFETTGTADLTITPDDQATIDDLDFISLTCGEEERTLYPVRNNISNGAQILENDIIFYPNWSCPEQNEVIHLVNVAGDHTLKFQFGDQIAYAYNSPDTETLRPNAAGDLTLIDTQFPNETFHWDKVDDPDGGDDNDTYVRHNDGSAETYKDLYNLPASSGSGTINFVKIYFRCKSIVGYHGKVIPNLKSNGTVTQGDEVKLLSGNPWLTFSQQWNTNPADAGDWEWADIDDLQIGIGLEGTGGDHSSLCTQVYIEVDYTPPNTAPTWDSITITPDPVKGGGTITVTANNEADAESDTLAIYCDESTNPSSVAGHYDVCSGTGFTSPYDISCQGTALTGNTSHTVYCRLWDGTDYSAEKSDTYTDDSTLPSISVLSPADDVSKIAIDSNLVITFSEAVDAESDNIYLYKTTGDVLIQAFDVTTDITGSGTDTITADPSSNLDGGTDYYVKIDATAFDDATGNSFAGIADKTTWNFTTATGFAIENIPADWSGEYALYDETGSKVTVFTTYSALYIKDTPDENIVVKFDITGDVDLNNDVLVDWNTDLGKAFVHNLYGKLEVGEITLYIPRLAQHNQVRMCPGAQNLTEVSSECSPSFVLSATKPTDPEYPTYSLSTSDDYWIVSGVQGTGGQGEEAGGEEAVPEFTTITFIIAAVAGFGIYFLIRRKKEQKK